MFSLFNWKKQELIFVLSVLVVILGISQLQLRVGQMKARDAQRKADVELVGRALWNYYEVYEQFPAARDGQIVMCGDILDLACGWGKDSLKDEEGIVYLRMLPQDPLISKGWQYVYEASPDGKGFRISVALEYRQDPAYKTNLTTSCSVGLQCNWYVGNY
ncbi:MAG: hypothetical protein Q7S31_02040 [bacterium]|nr:hypothetical protein [bacterium]